MADGGLHEASNIAFASGAMPGVRIELRGVWGRERLSRLFEYDLILMRKREEDPFTDDELDALLKAPCAISMGPRVGDQVHGLLESIELIDVTREVAPRYHARLVPSVWPLTVARSCRVYQDTTIPDMVTELLQLYGLSPGEDFELRILGDTPEYEYVVQYQESEWDFIQRWLEREGYFYWFEHSGSGDKLIIADSNAAVTPIKAPSTISYREINNLGADVSTVFSWNLHQRRVPAKVAVFDYNYRTPSEPLVATGEIDVQRGLGTVCYYGEHFKDSGQGKRVAKLRAERHLCERRTYTARTDCPRFRVGHRFELENHHDASHDGPYMITAIEHRAGYPVRELQGLVPTTSGARPFVHSERDDAGEMSEQYSARFEAIPYEVQFRPEMVTPWPSIHGVMHAHVASDTSGDYAQIDEQGRYKVKLPFDVSGRTGTRVSRWIRMAQPYSGSGYGTHFPLHKGAEVLLAYIDGDPDRPIIVGAVPNPQTASPTTMMNSTQSVIHTASGIRIELEDNQD
ncbi:hypothetical protein SOCE26_058120 [Sorangium cellulosum]|uniref:Gp5/Type VI secretion system Vgr protein OB-fold domain-containing protein n=1 Tax=Sorangium cellulosum TaxID=56 RepID=A0A2L0EYF7_SORCE|nr:type VI secretion system tip protein TssI/VgrG [Sorangium cellulosum]AUX44348.1 hypothetical protein SOCE26_058120 [Sorangium cellulosum]